MKLSILLIISLALFAQKTEAHDFETSRVDSHAPIGVMGDHTHNTGEIMLSYRFMHMTMSGMASGENSLSMKDLFNDGYSVYADDMDMQMHMIGAMYAPSDSLTLMGMIMYNRNTMDGTMKMTDSMSGGMGGGMKMMKHSMESDGLGDLRLSGLYEIADLGDSRIHLNLGLSIPTGSTNEKHNGMLMAYPMQLGSGTWDLLPGITYNAQTEDFSWGAQLGGTIRLGNNDGYSLGHAARAQAWLAKSWHPSVSTSLRINNELWGKIDGENSRLTMSKMKNPLANGALQGGSRSEIGIGINYYNPKGPLAGHRLAAEFVIPVYEDFDGIQMERDWTWILGWQYAF